MSAAIDIQLKRLATRTGVPDMGVPVGLTLPEQIQAAAQVLYELLAGTPTADAAGLPNDLAGIRLLLRVMLGQSQMPSGTWRMSAYQSATRLDTLENRFNTFYQLFTEFQMSVATTPALQPLQDQVDALSTLLQALSVTTSTTAVSARAVGAAAVSAVTASGTTAIIDPAGRANTQLVLTGLLIKTNTLPTVADLSTTITVTSTIGTTTTPVLTRTVVLAALPLVGNVLDILGNNGTTSNVYIPTGATLKVMATKGSFDFTFVLGIVAPAP